MPSSLSRAARRRLRGLRMLPLVADLPSRHIWVALWQRCAWRAAGPGWGYWDGVFCALRVVRRASWVAGVRLPRREPRKRPSLQDIANRRIEASLRFPRALPGMRDGGDDAPGGMGALRSRGEDRGGASPTPDRQRERQEPLSPAAQQQNDAAASLTALLAGPSASRRRPTDEDTEPAAKRGARSRLTWSPELHGRFLAAVQHLGVNTAVPKTILQARVGPRARLRGCALAARSACWIHRR